MLVERKGRLLRRVPVCVPSSVFCLVSPRKMSGEFAKSLGKGSPAPGPVPEGIIRLYSMRYCPFAQRTQLVLKAKGIDHEIVNINLKNKPEWFFEKSPFGMVPVLETSKGQLIYESPITCEFLDEAYPEKKLYPVDPYEKAYQKMLLEHFSKLPPISYKYILAIKSGEDASALKNEYQEKLFKLEEILANNKTKFFGGNSVSMIDYLIWPWFERMEAFLLLECLDHTPVLKCWVDVMKLDPAVQAIITDPQTFKGFLELYLKNSPEACDYGL
ncbi:glutathione S-transferase omega-1 isoform X1 [Candoia aspera]|uniref:glutathione S-transferase omega-1 isoform X1 n=2 Tax=Candoia aspera TaxID=51853 RepID=UPI002FD7F3B2